MALRGLELVTIGEQTKAKVTCPEILQLYELYYDHLKKNVVFQMWISVQPNTHVWWWIFPSKNKDE